jgi:hypothetical protein
MKILKGGENVTFAATFAAFQPSLGNRYVKSMKSFDEVQAERKRRLPTISTRLSNGEIVELAYRQKEQKTSLVIWNGKDWKTVDSVTEKEHRLIPYSAKNNLIQHKVILLPDEPEEYGTTGNLYIDIKAFLHRYVDISPVFEDIATSYILLSWVYDQFDELPYLRFRGDPGSGKTRCLLAIGSICYKPIFTSGASTVSPVFRLLDTVKGTLILDEGDFRLSDEKAEIIKILNNGNAKGFPVLRSELVNKHEFDPKAYYVFGPKVLATRGYFQDRALETRCLTEEMGQRRMRADIPLNLPEAFTDESYALRNKLLLYRFRYLSGNLKRTQNLATTVENRKLEPRMKQLLAPLLFVTPLEQVRETILKFAEGYQRELLVDKGTDIEAQVIEILSELAEQNLKIISVKYLTDQFVDRFAHDYERKITPKWIGSIVRKKIGLKTYKTQGNFVIPQKELSKLEYLKEKYGINL